jgi:ABC-2 type transport system ATP-binding protein
MSFIKTTDLCKTFKVATHKRGMMGAVRNLVSREYKVVEAVKDVSFEIAKGELVGYLGPNGAGKSTTIKMLTGILVPTTGSLMVGGIVPWQERKAHTKRIGVVFGQRTNLWWDLPLIESFELLKHIYKVPSERYRANLKIFEDMLELNEFMQTPVRSLSLGQRMRADLAAALMHDPEVVFLDEPTIGLDVVAKDRIRTFIKNINQKNGVTIILTTHDLGDVEKLCKRVMLIDQGQLLFDGALQTLRDRFSHERELEVDLAEAYPDVKIEGAAVLNQEGKKVTYRFSRDEMSASQLIQAVAEKFQIVDLTVREPEIETTIRHIYEQRLLSQEKA